MDSGVFKLINNTIAKDDSDVKWLGHWQVVFRLGYNFLMMDIRIIELYIETIPFTLNV